MSSHTAADVNKAIEYLTSHSWQASRLGLHRMQELMQKLQNPHKKLQFVHIAGTNGKSSTSAMLASVLQAAGYKTGLFTSPFVQYFNERMQINGSPISNNELAEITAAVRLQADKMEDHPTEFELVTAVGLLWFAQRGCDIVVLEVGLGGRLDATNIIPPPLLAVITTIALDHTSILGNTPQQIAAEKAGVIKQGSAVLSYPQTQQVEQVLQNACSAAEVPLHMADFSSLKLLSRGLCGQQFEFGGYSPLQLSLLGPYQLQNAALVVNAVQLLQTRGYSISAEALKKGLNDARWPARFELVCQKPYVIVDGGHNPQGAAALADGLGEYFRHKKVLLVYGVMADKNYQEMFRSVQSQVGEVFCVSPNSPRALAADQLAAYCTAEGSKASAYKSVEEGIHAALATADDSDVVCVFGSLYMAGQARQIFL